MRNLLYLCLLAALPCCAAPTVTLSEHADIRGTQITLGAIAVVAGSDAEVAQLSSIVLAPSPIPGQRFVISPAMIRVKLRQFGVDPATVTLVCPAGVEVTRMSQVVRGAALTAAAEAWLRARLTPAVGETLACTALSSPPDTATLDGVLAIGCAPGASDTGTYHTVQITATVDALPVWRGSITFRVQRCADALVAARPLAAHQTLDASCLTVQRCEITTAQGAPCTDAAALVGQRTTRVLRAGEVLTPGATEPLPVVWRNQEVTVVAHCGDLMIRLRAVACGDGGLGQTITVRNPQSRQEFSARVIAAGEVELSL